MSLPSPPILLDSARAASAHFASIAASPVEIALVGFLDPKWRLLTVIEFGGSSQYVVPSIRLIVRDAFACDATAAILAHSHPRGDPTPSAADLAFTRRLAATLRAIEVRLVDHLIFGGNQVVSLRARGLL